MKLLTGKVALVTGGSRGIGKTIVETFARQGATVCFTNLTDSESNREIEAYIAAQGVQGRFFEANAAKMEDAQRVIDAVIAEFGKIDIVVNNAGITKDGLLLRMTEEQWNAVIQTNLNSVFYHTKAATKQMMKQRSGSFINIGSVVGVGGNAGQANYAASKAGVIGFTKSVALELGSRNIRANVVAPGFIQTEMTQNLPEKEIEAWNNQIPLKRPGNTQDVADVCVFLASDMSNYVTGQVIHVDGGMLM